MNIAGIKYLTLLLTYLKPQWKRTLLMGVSLLTGIGLRLLNPQILRYFIDSASRHGAIPSLVGAGVLFIGVALLNQGVVIATTYLSGYVAWTATNQLRADLVAHCLSLDMSFHKERTSGEMIERIDGDVDALSNFFSQFMVHLISNVLLLVGGLILLFTAHWLVGVAMTAFAAAATLILLYVRRRTIPLLLERRQIGATFFGFLSERLVGTEDIRANGATDYILRRFNMLLREFAAVWLRFGRVLHLMGVATNCIFLCGSALALALGAYLWSTGLEEVLA